jgi:DNA-damage-inducible protein D
MVKNNKLVVFQDKNIRRVWHNGDWFFSVVDVVAALTESSNARRYWSDLKSNIHELEGFEVYENIVQLKLKAPDSKLRLTDCANTKSLFRIIQSIPSKKAEPFKQWLAQVGYERIEEIENPEIGQNRIREYYKFKGYPKSWIEKRIRGIAIRQDLVNEWEDRKVKKGKEFALLTNEISKATFNKTVEEYKEHKSLTKQNLRDHMTDWELILTMIGEKASTDMLKNKVFGTPEIY